MAFTVSCALYWWRRECPHAKALIVDGSPLTYEELYAWTSHIGKYLQVHGVKSGDRVTIVAKNSLEYAVLIFAIMRIGSIGTPINFRSTAREVKEALQEFEPAVIFADHDRYDTVAEALASDTSKLKRLEDLNGFRSTEEISLSHAPSPDSPVFIIGTSGSTGRPKGVIYTHRMIMSYASEFALMEPRCAHGSSVLSVGPFSSSSGYLLLLQFTAMGVSMFLESQFQPDRALKLLEEEKITTFQAAPIFFERISVLDKFKDADLTGLYFAQVGGATVSDKLLQSWRRKGVILRQAYGNTEAGGAWAARDDTALTEPEKCGRGGMFTEYAVRNKDGEITAPGEPGEITIYSPSVTIGYWNNPEATSEAIKDGWFYTGDLGVMDENGNLKFLDRIKEIIISGGLNISAAEVEKVILELDGVKEVAVIPAKDRQFGETPLAIVHSDDSSLTRDSIVEHCNNHLSNYKVPRYIAFEVDPLPRLPSGKIARPALRKKYEDAEKNLPKVR